MNNVIDLISCMVYKCTKASLMVTIFDVANYMEQNSPEVHVFAGINEEFYVHKGAKLHGSWDSIVYTAITHGILARWNTRHLTRIRKPDYEYSKEIKEFADKFVEHIRTK